MMDSTQQVLPVFRFNDSAYFESFFVTETSRLLVNSLHQLLQSNAEDFVLISASAGLGKSHLLQAICHKAEALEQSHLYLPLQEVKAYAPADVLAGHEHIRILCLDDLQAIAGLKNWEEALFNLYNQRLQQGLPLYVSANKTVATLALTLADLVSRLSAMLSFHLHDLNDDEKGALLQFRAAQRGMEINDACVSYIIQRSGRSLSELMHLLEKLDQHSLVQGRKITVPFIKTILS